jgi:hypothetical protein
MVDAIQCALNDRSMKHRAALLGQSIRSADEVARAIEAFEELLLKL